MQDETEKFTIRKAVPSQEPEPEVQAQSTSPPVGVIISIVREIKI